jgi:nitrite reductase/ring-hydroxylating ferredoxin subunit
MTSEKVLAGASTDLHRNSRLLTKVGSLPVLVVWDGERAFAIEDRCPHLGFPLRQGTIADGLVTCHWHHARFDLTSGCTLDPWADDAIAFDVSVDANDVWVWERPVADPAGRLAGRLRDGLEQGITLVTAKAVLGLLEIDGGVEPIVRTALEFGARYRAEGWGSGATVLVAMANVLPHLDPPDRALALVQALAFVSRDTRGHAPRFAEPALAEAEVPLDRLADWYRRFVETRSSDAAERVLATAIATGDLAAAEAMQFAAVTDHVFIDEGHTLDFTNKAYEALALVGAEKAGELLPSVVRQTCAADRSEESSEWQHPRDIARLVADCEATLPVALSRAHGTFTDVAALAWTILGDDPEAITAAILESVGAGATPEQLGRAVAYAAALRLVRFHVQNDHGDWNTVHHAFTTANALHQALSRNPTPELMRGVIHSALRVHLDRFLNVPAARLPESSTGTLAELSACFETQGDVDRAGSMAWGFLAAGGERAELIAGVGHALLAEDAEFHWFQVYEAAVRQSLAWPAGSDESALVLVGLARFLAAHTPTRRELPTVVRIAARLRRGERVFEEEG